MEWKAFDDQDWTGRCYAGAYHLAECLAADGLQTVIVHGSQTSSGIKHAWVEVGNVVADATKPHSLLAPFKSQAFYQYYQARFRYTFEEARDYYLQTQHYGPWEESAAHS